MKTTLTVSVPWTRRWTLGKNRYDRLELAGAFGDVGTLMYAVGVNPPASPLPPGRVLFLP
jgi:hypothetical protein